MSIYQKILIQLILFTTVFVNPIRGFLNVSFLHLFFISVYVLFSWHSLRLYKYLVPFTVVVLLTAAYNYSIGTADFSQIIYSIIQYLILIHFIPAICYSKGFRIGFYSNSILVYGLLLILGGYIHYSGNYSIFGLINEPIWSELQEYEQVRYRMISFISSPQNYSAITYLILIIAFYSKASNIWIRYLYILLYIPQIFISGTRLPLITFLVFISIDLITKTSLKKIFSYTIVTLLFILAFNSGFNSFSRFSIERILLDNPIYTSWIYYINQLNLSNIFISNHFGLVQTYSDQLDPESFLIKAIYELGIIGIITFLPIANRYINLKKNTFNLHISLIFIIASFLTPAFSGSIFPIFCLPYLIMREC